jgi:hypothetical protein
VAVALAAGVTGQGPKFYSDDPLQREPESQDASKAQPWEIPLTPDLIINLFGQPGDPVLGQRAGNINTIDEVPDSSWFTNRIYAKAVSTDEISRGPNTMDGPSGRWTVIRAKTAGVAPGFTVRDENGEIWFVSFDGKDNPIAPTAAAMVATKLFHTLGYNQVETYLTKIQPANISIDPEASVREHGRRRPIVQKDIDDVLDRAAVEADGSYRAIVGRGLPGRILGGFKYFGTRPDDPNDIVPHEHRRELRAARVFGAWLNHDDSRGVNSLDMLEPQAAGGAIKHYMFDFGSILGSGTVFAQARRAVHEYIFEHAPGWRTLATLGFTVRPWMRIDYPDVPASVGRFEGDGFEPESWKPEYPNAAFENMRPEDAFWGARIVSRFTNEAIRAIVEKARYSDPKATDYITDVLIKRRDKVLRRWLTGVNPIVDLKLAGDGALSFANAATAAGVAPPADRYTLQWFRFDNATDTRTDGETVTVSVPTATAPPALLSTRAGDYIGVAIAASHADHPAWARPATFYFRRTADAWEWVGAARE